MSIRNKQTRQRHTLPGPATLADLYSAGEKATHADRQRSRFDRKSAQLCAQIRRALQFIVPDVLQQASLDATVVDVHAAPNTSHLLVILQPIKALDESGCRQLELAVVQRAGLIRTEVAQAINRRKTPSFSFRVIPLMNVQ